MIHAGNENPMVGNPRLAGLTSWDADWRGLRVVVAGIGVSGFAAADTLIELGARVVVLDGNDTARNRQRADTLRIVGALDINLGQDAMTYVPDVAGERPDLVVTSPGSHPRIPCWLLPGKKASRSGVTWNWRGACVNARAARPPSGCASREPTARPPPWE